MQPSDSSPIPDWAAFYAVTLTAQPAATLMHALQRFERETRPRRRRLAVDLGCGVGRDTVELLRQGWRVLAIDREPGAIEGLLNRPDLAHADRLITRVTSFQEALIPSVDLINASNSLPFCSPDSFAAVWSRITSSLRVGGRFAGQLFGESDEWAALSDRTHHSRAAVVDLLEQFDVELLQEMEFDGATRRGQPKHWHVFHVVARRRP